MKPQFPFLAWAMHILRMCCGLGAAILVASCGGGNGEETAVQSGGLAFQPKAGIFEPSATSAASLVVNGVSENGLTIGIAQGPEFQGVAVGSLVSLPPDTAKNLPFGFTGKVAELKNGNGTLELRLVEAGLTDVYKTLNYNYDSAIDGVRVVGLVGTDMSVTSVSQKQMQNGLSLDLGIEVDSKGLNFHDSVGIDLAPESASDETKKAAPKITLELTVSELSIKRRAVIVERPCDGLSTAPGSVSQLCSVVTSNSSEAKGKVNVKIGIKQDFVKKEFKNSELYSLLSKYIKSKNKIKWDDLDREFLGFRLHGLDGKDKEGLLPLGGIVLAPAQQTFYADNVKGFTALKNSSVIVWFYLQLDGQVKVVGDFTALEYEYPFDMKFGVEEDETAELAAIDSEPKSSPTLKSTLKGEVGVGLKAGITLGLDAFVGGMRPFAVRWDLVEFQPEMALKANDAGIAYYPKPELVGSICYRAGFSLIASKFTVMANIGAKKKVKGRDGSTVNADLGYKIEYPGYDLLDQKSLKDGEVPFFKKLLGSPQCYIPAQNDIVADYEIFGKISPNSINNVRINFSRSGSAVLEYGDTLTIRDQWAEGDEVVKLEKINLKEPVEISLSEGATHLITVTVSSRDYGPLGVMPDKKIAIPKEFSVNIQPNLPGGNCKNVRLEAKISELPAGKIDFTYVWKVRQNNIDIPVNPSGVPVVNVALPSCSPFVAEIAVAGSEGSTAASKLTITPESLAAKVTSVTPKVAEPGKEKAFLVTGANLPLTAVLAVEGATCRSPSKNTASGFEQICLLDALPGNKKVTVKSNTLANGGEIIDDTYSVDVLIANEASGKLPDTGITAAQCYAAGSDALVSCTSAAAIALNPKQDGMVGRDVSSPSNTDGKLGFSYSTVGSYSKEECVKDNITGLTWEGKPTTGLRAAGNTYTNYGDNSASDASTYVAAVNAAKLCGYSDWRLPTADELQTLVDYSVAYPGPTIDATWFPNTQRWYWSATPYAGNASFAWVVSFLNGNVDYYYRNNGLHVRLVR